MAQNDELAVALRELKAVGIRPTVEVRGKHRAVTWQVSPDKEQRTYFVASTGSDHRGPLNVRADVRRYLRADGVSLKEQQQPRTNLQKALQLPLIHETLPDQVSALRAEVADLTDLLLALQDDVKQVLACLVPQQVKSEEPAKEAPRSRYANGRRKKDISGMDLIKRIAVGGCTKSDLTAALAAHGFARTSLAPMLSQARKAGFIEERNGIISLINGGTAHSDIIIKTEQPLGEENENR